MFVNILLDLINHFVETKVGINVDFNLELYLLDIDVKFCFLNGELKV